MTEHLRRTSPLNQSGRRAERLDDLPIAVLVIEDGEVALVNDEWTELTGRSIDQSMGTRWLEVLHEDDRDAAAALVQQPTDRDIEGYDWRLLREDGAEKWVHARIRHLPEVGRGRCVLTITEIDDRKINELRLLHLATHDPTTGLPNRKVFATRLEEAIAAAPEGAVAAVLFIDLDGFKGVNDRLGHRFGDMLLVAVAGRIEGALRPSDLVSRLGGDEFGVLCTGLAQVSEAAALAERVVDVLAAPFVLDGQVVQISGSIGLALAQGTPASTDDLVEAADLAMYQAKQAGGNRWCSHDDLPADGAARRTSSGPARRLQASARRAAEDATDLLAHLIDDLGPGSAQAAAIERSRVLIERAIDLIDRAVREDDSLRTERR